MSAFSQPFPYGQHFNNPNGQFFYPNGQPFNNPNGQFFNNPNDQPFNNPYGQFFNNPNGQPFNNPYGQPFNNPNGQPFSNTYGHPFNNLYGQPFNNPNGHRVPSVEQRPVKQREPIKFVSAGLQVPAAAPPPELDGCAIVHESPICDLCGDPITENNECKHSQSFGHRPALPKVNTPLSIDRTRIGLKVMEKYGFDVDAGKGLGATEQGILYPITLKNKQNTLGLGMEKIIQKEKAEKRAEKRRRKKMALLEQKAATLDAGKTGKLADEEEKQHEGLLEIFHGDGKLEKYLGDGKVDNGLK